MVEHADRNQGLFHEAVSFLKWHAYIFTRLFRASPIPTMSTILCLVIAEFAQMLSFFLPLKILILLGTEGVPRYFRAFMTESSRDLWIVVLCALTVAFSVLSILLRFASKRVSNSGASQLLHCQTEDRNERRSILRRAQRAFSQICRSYADLSIAVLGLGVILLIYPEIGCVVIGLFLIEFMWTHYVLSATGSRIVEWLRVRISRNYPMYLKYLSTLNFLALFFLLVAAYMLSENQEIVPAILALLLGRRSFPALTRYIKAAVSQTRRTDTLTRNLFQIA